MAALVALAAACCPAPALADIQTVAPSQLTQLARPLPKQTVDKSKIWTLFLGGAGVLFVGTVLAENKEEWFPAISRANKAMEMSRKATQQREQQQQKQGGKQ